MKLEDINEKENVEVTKVGKGIYKVNIEAPRLNKNPHYKTFFQFGKSSRHKHGTITPEELSQKIYKGKTMTCK